MLRYSHVYVIKESCNVLALTVSMFAKCESIIGFEQLLKYTYTNISKKKSENGMKWRMFSFKVEADFMSVGLSLLYGSRRTPTMKTWLCSTQRKMQGKGQRRKSGWLTDDWLQMSDYWFLCDIWSSFYCKLADNLWFLFIKLQIMWLIISLIATSAS